MERAIALLERVRLTRVFNFIGLLEVVEEMKHVLLKSDRVALVSKIANSEVYEASLAEEISTQSKDKSDRQLPRSIELLVVDNVTNILDAELSGNQVHGMCCLVSILFFFKAARLHVLLLTALSCVMSRSDNTYLLT